MRYYLILITMAIIFSKRQEITSVGKNVGQREPLGTVGM